MGRLIIDGNSVYEIDEECENRKMQSTEKKRLPDRTFCRGEQKHERKRPGKKPF